MEVDLAHMSGEEKSHSTVSMDAREGSSSASFASTIPGAATSSLQEQIEILREERARFAFAQQVGRIGTFEWNILNNEITWTPELEVLYGLRPGEFEGRYENWEQRVHPEDIQQARESLQRAVKDEIPYEAEFRVIWPDQSIHWLKARGELRFTNAQTARRMIGVNIDITPQKEAEQRLVEQTALLQAAHQELQDLNTNLEGIVAQRTSELLRTAETLGEINAELERSNRELQDFAHVASHDLQEPLRKIQAFGNLLEEEYGAQLGDGKAYLDRMRNAAARMQGLINDLLTFARVTTKAQPFSQVDLNVIASEAIDDLEASIRAARGKIEVGPLPIIEADPLQMRQMVQNLLSNALKFHRAGVAPRVKVSAEVIAGETSEDMSSGEQWCRLVVEDNGIGFDEKYLDRIFTVFQRLHGKSEYEGTGIGLAVVRKIVLRHNGTITARSEPGQGAIFILTLPISQGGKDTGAYDE